MSFLKTGIDGLDEILKGGIPSGGSIVLEGPTDSGKTLFGLQFICKNKEPSLLLSFMETEESLSSYSERFELGYSDLNKQKKIIIISDLLRVYKALVSFRKSILCRLLNKHKIKIIVIDNLNALNDSSQNPLQFREIMSSFLREMKEKEITCILIKEENTLKEMDYLADMVIKIERDPGYSRKTLTILKSKTNVVAEGRHLWKVNGKGLELYPNLGFLEEKYLKNIPKTEYLKVETGLGDLDEILEGGVLKGDAVLVGGPSGTGKTIIGLNFLKTGVKLREKCLYIGFDISMNKLIKSAEVIDFDLYGGVNNLYLNILNLPETLFIEEMLDRISKIITDKKIDRVVIDEFGKFSKEPQDLKRVMKILNAMLAGKTSLFMVNINDRMDFNLQEAIFEIMDKVILLKYTEIEGKIEKIIYILKAKVRFDSSMRRLEINERGIYIGNKYESYRNILSGSAVKDKVRLVTYKAKITEEIISDFLRVNPDVEVEILDTPGNWGDISYKKERMSGQKNIGVIPLNFEDVQLLAKDGLLLELDKVLREEDRKDFFKAGLEGCTFNGHLYAVPDDIKCMVIVYRKDLLRKYGLSIPETWDQLIHQIKHIILKEKNPELAGLMWPTLEGIGLVKIFLEMLYSNGGDIFNKYNKIDLTEKNVNGTLQFMSDLIYKYKIVPPEVLVASAGDRMKKVCEGNVIFYLCSSVRVNEIMRDKRHEFGLMRFPQGPNGKEKKSLTWGFAYAIPKWNLYPQTSIELLKFLTSYENQKRCELVGGNAFSSRKKVCYSEEVLEQKPYYKYASLFLEESKIINCYNIPAFEGILPVLEEAVKNALNNKLDINDNLKNTQGKLKKIEVKPLYSFITNSAINYLQENMYKPLRLTDVAKFLNLSPAHLSRIFKAESDRTIVEYLTYIRMEKAKAMLKDVKLNMTDVGLQCGFTDLNYFSRIFKKMNGYSPSEYRRKMI